MADIQAAVRDEIADHLASSLLAMSEDPWFLAQAMAAANDRPDLLDTWFFRGRDLAECWSRVEAGALESAAGEETARSRAPRGI